MPTMSNPDPKRFSRNWRLLGFLPLAFFLARLGYFIHYGGTSQILWMCHLSNLTLAIGLLFDLPLWVGVSAYWLILAIPFWVVDVLGFGMEGMTSFATHAGGTIIAVLALFRIYPPRRIWADALAWHLVLHAVCRFFKPPELNINVAHAIYRGWERFFSDYFSYWLLITALAGGALYLLDVLVNFMMQWRRKAERNETFGVD